MTNSFQPQDYSIASNDVGVIAQDVSSVYSDTVTIDLSSLSSDTITLTSGSYNTSVGYSTMTTSTGSYNTVLGGAGISAISITDLNASQFNWHQEEFVNCLPDVDRIKKMCDQYPGLKLAYDKFVTTYKLVKDDYDSPPEKRIKP